MPIVRAQASFMMDTAFPRDRMVMTPHFNVGFNVTNPVENVDGTQLAQDLADALDGWSAGSQEINVRIYDAQGTPPVQPIGNVTKNVGVVGQSAQPREVALCLSYYSGINMPKRRGRLYMPAALLDFQSAQRLPSTANIAQGTALAGILQALGGTNVDWVVYSRVDDAAHPVTNYWIDNEWDTMRSRGGRATTRTSGTTSEA